MMCVCGRAEAMPNCHYCYQCAKEAGLLKKDMKIGKYFFQEEVRGDYNGNKIKNRWYYEEFSC